MIVKPKMRGFVCTTAHPVGCEAVLRAQADIVRKAGAVDGPKRVLVVGASTGYGLACRLAAAIGCGADTVGVSFERAARGDKTASPGWYNNRFLEKLSGEAGVAAYTVEGDAFADETKAQTIDAIKRLPGGQVDLFVYSVAAPRRTDPKTGQVYKSVIKPIGGAFRGRTVDFQTGRLFDAEIAPATDEEIAGTVGVMGGADWELWVDALQNAGALADGACTVAFSYIGPAHTHAIYANGTIGRAKTDLERAAIEITTRLAPVGGAAFVSVNKALVTQASAAIPIVPLYISLLYRVMKERGTHEGCTEQMTRMFHRLYGQGAHPDWSKIPLDEKGRIRMDDWEMKPEIQQAVQALWPSDDVESLEGIGDLAGYREAFNQLFGFCVPGVDYDADVEI